MQPVYLINDTIYFFADKKKLAIDIQGKQEITLTQPAAKCLEILLKTEGLVLQKDVYDFAWGENGHNVAPNTLYQNISLIRRALNQLQPDAGRWIITVPRKGFRMAQPITLIAPAEMQLPAEAQLPAETRLLAEAQLPAEMQLPAETRLPTARPAGGAIIAAPTETLPAEHPRLLPPFMLVLLVAMLLLLITFAPPGNASFQVMIDSYHRLEKRGDCQLFLFAHKKAPPEEIDHRVHSHVDCARYPYVYIVHNRLAQNTLLFSCRSPLTDKDFFCASWSLRSRA